MARCLTSVCAACLEALSPLALCTPPSPTVLYRFSGGAILHARRSAPCSSRAYAVQRGRAGLCSLLAPPSSPSLAASTSQFLPTWSVVLCFPHACRVVVGSLALSPLPECFHPFPVPAGGLFSSYLLPAVPFSCESRCGVLFEFSACYYAPPGFFACFRPHHSLAREFPVNVSTLTFLGSHSLPLVVASLLPHIPISAVLSQTALRCLRVSTACAPVVTFSHHICY